MKKYAITLLSALTIFAFTACIFSKEDQAEKLISSCIKDYLPYPDSYEPISTVIDSTFADVTTDEESFNLCQELIGFYSKVQVYSSRMKRAKTTMNIYNPSRYSTIYIRGEYNQAKKSYDENQRLLNKTYEKIKEKTDEIKNRQEQFSEKEFNGWKATHRYRSFDEDQKLSPPIEMIFLCNKDFTYCIGWETETFETMETVLKAVVNSENIEDIKDIILEDL